MANTEWGIYRTIERVKAMCPDVTEDEIRDEIMKFEQNGCDLFVDTNEAGHIEVGHGCAGTFYSDWDPYEIVDVISDKTVEVRRLRESRNFANWPDQCYILFTDDSMGTKRIRKTKRHGWYRKGERFSMSGASYYRDPSF